jgi:hypothetical protein
MISSRFVYNFCIILIIIFKLIIRSPFLHVCSTYSMINLKKNNYIKVINLVKLRHKKQELTRKRACGDP